MKVLNALRVSSGYPGIATTGGGASLEMKGNLMSGYFFESVLNSFGLETGKLRPLLSQAKIRSYEAGDTLAKRGASSPSLIFIVSGLVLATVEEARDLNAISPVMAYGEGMWIGAVNAISNKKTDFSYLAAGDVSTIEFPHALINSMLDLSPSLHGFLVSQCIEEAGRYTQTLIPMKAACSAYRVICGLAMLAETFEYGRQWQRRSKMLHREASQGVTIALPQCTLAALCGVSRSVLSPTLRPFKEHGWLEVEYNRTRICRPEAWALLAQSMREHTRDPDAVSAQWACDELDHMESPHQLAAA